MIEWLTEIDRALFLFVNIKLANPVTDLLMPIITSDNVLRIGYGLTMILLLWKGSARLRWMVLFSIIALTISDQLSSTVLKPLLERPRPCQLLTDINLLVNCGAGYAMPSAHAANSFAQAALFGFLIRKTVRYLAIIATLIALSRVFVGVHYPGDIMAGAIIGAVIGLLIAGLFVKLKPRLIQNAIQD